MPFSRWLRTRSEHYLLVGAQERVARRYGARSPRRPHGAAELFWRRVFAPTYRVLPWKLRHRIMLTMPGSHRQQWAPPPQLAGSAVLSSTRQERGSRDGADRG
jgi:hypothetical protein